MKNFKTWLENKLDEGMPANYTPVPRATWGIGANSTPASATIKKLARAEDQGKMIFSANFAGIDAIQTAAGLDDEELNILKKSGLITKTEHGYTLDKNKFAKLHNAILMTVRGE